jgi:hypothetical protein
MPFLCHPAFALQKNWPYKISRTTDLGKRELALRTANPFLTIVAKKESSRNQRKEKEIHSALKERRFEPEWYKLTDEQYTALFNDFHFKDYSEDERAENLRLARTVTKARSSDLYHVFKKPKKDSTGKRFYRWYYYFWR